MGSWGIWQGRPLSTHTQHLGPQPTLALCSPGTEVSQLPYGETKGHGWQEGRSPSAGWAPNRLRSPLWWGPCLRPCRSHSLPLQIKKLRPWSQRDLFKVPAGTGCNSLPQGLVKGRVTIKDESQGLTRPEERGGKAQGFSFPFISVTSF